ncbi:glycosyltransferase family 4 protein [Clostridium botulinum]|nr:glycosyltransferase family 4 protein [Clostridium botulinum]
MNICMDGLSLYNMNGIGLNTYCYGLLEGLFSQHPEGQYNLIWDESPYIDEWSKYKCVKYIDMNINRIAGNYRPLEKFLETNNIDIYHSPNNGFSIPNNKICKYVITVHDLLPITNSHYVDEKYSKKFKTVFPNVLPKVDKIIAVSNFIKGELISYFNIPENKIQVIYPTAYFHNNNTLKDDSKNILKHYYGIEGDFIFYVGSIHPRKNIKTLITAFKDVVKYNKSIKLVLVGKIDGKRDTYYNQLKILISRMDLQDNIKFTGIVPHDHILYFLNQCICQVNFPEYDGFSMSVIEAMNQGVPLICSKHPSIKEVANNSCMYVDIKNNNNIANSILEVIHNKKIRNNIIKDEIERSRLFSFQKSSKQIFSLYKSLK